MAKTANPQDDLESAVAGLTPAVSIEEFRDDVTNVFLHYVRNIAWMVDAKTAWAITKAPALEYEPSLFDPDLKATDLELEYEHIQETEFARAMQRMYDFAYLGQIDLSAESLTNESIHTWVSALVVDVASSSVANEWDSYGLDIVACARRCVQVAEMANARVILEEGESFFDNFCRYGKEDSPEEGLLTVRQVAMLAAMEEMSVRAAANPNRANQLKPTKTENGTRFESAVVKEWLQQKKRYLPITKRWSEGQLNLAQKSFRSLDEVAISLDARYNMLGLEHGFERLNEALAAIGLVEKTIFGKAQILLPDEVFTNNETVRGLARALSLPDELLVLRVKEVLAAEGLRAIERAIKDLGEQ